MPIRTLPLALTAALLSTPAAVAQDRVPPPPAAPPPIAANPTPSAGWNLEAGFPLADTAAALKAGFVLADREQDHWGDPMRDVVAEHFVDPAGASVGRRPPLDFSYDLMDLTGTGYRSLILWPRITQLQPRKPDRGGVLRIYNFDGRDWHLALDDAAMMLGVRPHLDGDYHPTGAMDLALLEEDGFKLFVFDEAAHAWAERGQTPVPSAPRLPVPVPDDPR